MILDLLKELKLKAKENKDTKIIGRTHGVYAEETFLGNIFGNWYLEIKRSLDRVERAKVSVAYGKLSGPVGNHTVVTEEMEKITLEKLGLKPEIFASQIVSRDRYAEVFTSLSILASTYERISTNLRSYQRSEISEMYEPFKDGQKGSSAMPHKKNPIGSERITGLARIVRGYTLSGLENMVLWNERDISNSSVERIALPDCFNLICFMTSELTSIISDLVINYEQIEINLNNAKSKTMSQQILSHLVNVGIDRGEAYKVIQEESFKNSSPDEFKTNLKKHFNVEFPNFDTHENKNINEEFFEDKLT